MRLYSKSVNANLTRAYVLGCVAASGLIIATAMANTTAEDANPYSVISDKNVFHLNPPPPPPSADSAKPPDLQKVMLSGFQKVGNLMKVYLAIPAKDPKDTAYLALQAGEKASDVEIVKIRADKQEVDIINSGTPMTLTIASNGFALSGGGGGGGGVVAKGGGAPGPGTPGFHHLPEMRAPPPNAPTADARTERSDGNSSIIVGGGSGNSGSTPSFGSPSYNSSSAASGYNGYSGGAVVTGGTTPVNTSGEVPNSPASQIANSLLPGGTTGQYHMPVEAAAPAPPEVQAAGLLVAHAAGGPPAPPIEEDGQ
jgi:hypothetical protein